MCFHKINIAHLTFDMRIGGAEQVILNLVENTDPKYFNVSVLCINQPVGQFGKQLQKKGYQLNAFNRKPGFDISLILQVRAYILKNNIDVLHCHQYTPYVYGVFAAFLSKCKVIFTEHGRFFPDQRKRKRVLINPLLNLITDRVTAISEATRDALVAYENFSHKKIQVIYNGLDDTKFINPTHSSLKQQLGLQNCNHILGTIARLDPIKNQKMMINALQQIIIHFPDTVLVIVGDGPERESLESLVSELELKGRVVFTGFREDTQLFYQIFTVFLLTSFSEGTAMTLLESMASGIPCIATDVGGNPEIVKDRETGLIIPNDDINALAKAVIDLFRNPALAVKYGKAGRKLFKETFTVQKMVNSFEKLYND